MSTVKLKRLKIDQYRNVRPGTELHFDDGVNLVLGQNGSGKTTLLNLISVIVSHDFSGLKDESFNLEYELLSEQCTTRVQITNRARQDPATEEFLPDESRAPGNQQPLDFRYRVYASALLLPELEIIGTPSSVAVTISGTPLPERPPASPFAPAFLIDALADATDHLSTFYRAIVSLHAGPVTRFDESLDCFLAMTGRSPVSSGIGSPPVTRLRVRGPLGASPPRYASFEFSPWGLAQTIITAYASPAGELRLDLTGETPASPDSADPIAFLRNAAQLMGMSAAAFKPEVHAVTEDRQRKTYEINGFSYTFTSSGNTKIHHDRLSYGQKRLIAYFYYRAATRSFIIADELVNGLHHSWIKACMDAIGERQAFLTSQNPLLFEYVEFDSIEQVVSRFITCKSELVDGAEQLVWQNMPRDDAERFYRGYEAEIESIGDILINRGLW